MVKFRRFLLASVLIATFAASSGAQVLPPPDGGGPGGGPGAGGPLTCRVVDTATPTQARAESYSALVGDIVIECTGGSLTATVPTANITVALNNTIVTSRVFANGLSEALLLIDEPGFGAGVGPAGLLPQTLCGGGALGPAQVGARPCRARWEALTAPCWPVTRPSCRTCFKAS